MKFLIPLFHAFTFVLSQCHTVLYTPVRDNIAICQTITLSTHILPVPSGTGYITGINERIKMLEQRELLCVFDAVPLQSLGLVVKETVRS